MTKVTEKGRVAMSRSLTPRCDQCPNVMGAKSRPTASASDLGFKVTVGTSVDYDLHKKNKWS